MGQIVIKGTRFPKKGRSAQSTIKNSIREMKNRYLPQIFRKIWQQIETRLFTALEKFERLCLETFSPDTGVGDT